MADTSLKSSTSVYTTEGALTCRILYLVPLGHHYFVFFTTVYCFAHYRQRPVCMFVISIISRANVDIFSLRRSRVVSLAAARLYPWHDRKTGKSRMNATTKYCNSLYGAKLLELKCTWNDLGIGTQKIGIEKSALFRGALQSQNSLFSKVLLCAAAGSHAELDKSPGNQQQPRRQQLRLALNTGTRSRPAAVAQDTIGACSAHTQHSQV